MRRWPDAFLLSHLLFVTANPLLLLSAAADGPFAYEYFNFNLPLEARDVETAPVEGRPEARPCDVGVTPRQVRNVTSIESAWPGKAAQTI